MIKSPKGHKVLYLLFQFFISPFAEKITQSSDQIKMIIISQLGNSISRFFQKIIKYFNGTAILTCFVFPAAGVFPVIIFLYWNNSDFVMLSFGSPL